MKTRIYAAPAVKGLSAIDSLIDLSERPPTVNDYDTKRKKSPLFAFACDIVYVIMLPFCMKFTPTGNIMTLFS